MLPHRGRFNALSPRVRRVHRGGRLDHTAARGQPAGQCGAAGPGHGRPGGPQTRPVGDPDTRAARAAAAAVPAQAKTWGGSGTATTLVLYDTTNSWGYLGQLYAIAGGNLASHFGKVTAEPVANYVSGQVNNYTATIYIGSTYNEPLPLALLNDVLSTTHP